MNIKCQLCGEAFTITTQLRDRDWRFRRSGLFGRDDNQEGSIPVALTLQQLDTLLTGDHVFATAMEISATDAPIEPCEVDFVLLTWRSFDRKVEVAIGEAKTHGEIQPHEITKLGRMADAFPRERFEPYILFTKTGTFTEEEVARCREADDPTRPRVILLTGRELEPDFVYERTAKEFDISSTAISLEDLARATQRVFFEPKRRSQSQ